MRMFNQTKVYFGIIVFLFISLLNQLFAQSSTVYFYRPEKFPGNNKVIKFKINDSQTIRLHKVEIIKVDINSPIMTFKMLDLFIDNKIDTLKVESGKTYYVRVDYNPKLGPIDQVKVQYVPESIGEKEVWETEYNNGQIQLPYSSNPKVLKTNSIVQIPTRDENKCLIYFFRPKKFFAWKMPVKIKLSDSLKLSVANNASFVYSSEPGELFLLTTNRDNYISDTSLKLRVEKGKVYFVHIYFDGYVIRMKEATKDEARKMMEQK